MTRRAARRRLIEDFAAIMFKDVRRRLGRHAMAGADEIDIFITADRVVRVRLLPRVSNVGIPMKVFSCPSCNRGCRVLRVIPEERGLACGLCLQRRFAVRYRCQATHPSAWPREQRRAVTRTPGKEVSAT